MAGLIGTSSLTVLLALGMSQPIAPPSSTFTITGKVVYSSGAIPAKLIVMVHSPTRHGSDGESCEMTPDGHFTARWLRSGTYLLQAIPSEDGPDDHPTGYERGFATVTIKDADVSGVVITTAPGVRVLGRVRFDESRPGASRPGLIMAHAALAVTEWVGPFESARVADDGTFELHDIRGPRVFRFGWQLSGDRSYWAPGQILLDGRDITNVPVDFSREPKGDLVIVFRQRISTIVGRVEDVAGLPTPGACVAMLPEDPDEQHGWSTAVGTAEIDARGRFYFSGMPPGAYLVAPLDAASCPPPNVVIANARTLSRRATRATVTDGATVRVVLTLATTTARP